MINTFLNCSCCSKCMARCILCPLAKLMSGDEVLAAILGLGGRNYQSVYCSYNFSFVTFIHFPGWQKPPWTTSLVRFGSLWAPSGPPPLFSSTPNPSWWAKRGVAALVGEHHHLPTPTPRWRWRSMRAVTVLSRATWVSCSTATTSEANSSCQLFMCDCVREKYICQAHSLAHNYQSYRQPSPQGTGWELKHWMYWSLSILNFPTPLRSCWSWSVNSLLYLKISHSVQVSLSPLRNIVFAQKIEPQLQENVNITSWVLEKRLRIHLISVASSYDMTAVDFFYWSARPVWKRKILMKV